MADIDYRIPLGIQTTADQRRGGPIITMGQILAAKDRDFETEKYNRDQAAQFEEEEAVREAFRSNTRSDGSPDYDKIVNVLSPRYPLMATKLQGIFAEGRKKAADAKDQELSHNIKKFEQGLKISQGITDEATFQALWPQIQQMSPELGGTMTAYDPARLAQLQRIAFTAMQLQQQRRDALQDWKNGDTDGGFLRYLRTAQSQQEWDETLKQARSMGVPEPLLERVGATWSPAAAAKAGELSLTYKERLDQTNKEADDKRTDEHYKAMERAAQTNADASLERAKRAAAGGGAAGLTPAAVETTRRGAERWKQDQIATLERSIRSGVYNQEKGITERMTPAQIEAERERIEEGYYGMVGQQRPDNPTLPRGVQNYMRDIKRRYKTFEQAQAELLNAMPDLKRDHPNLDEETARLELARAYGVSGTPKSGATGVAPQAAPAAQGAQTTPSRAAGPGPAVAPNGAPPTQGPGRLTSGAAPRIPRANVTPEVRKQVADYMNAHGFKGVTPTDPRVDQVIINNKSSFGIK